MNIDYDPLFQDVVNHIKTAQNNISIIKEKAILEIYWNMGVSLQSIIPLTGAILKDIRNQMNQALKSDALLNEYSINTYWLKLAVVWVKEHKQHDQSVILSGLATWVDWALVLDIVNSPTQRYWLICQKIKNKWDTLMLLREAQKLPDEYLNVGDNYR